MNFNDFLKYIPKIESEKLLAEKAHLLMSPPERIEMLIKENNFIDKNPKRAAVLMLFYPKDNETHLALIVRNSYPGVHSSQIAFPGGKVEMEDVSLQHTALRETYEEIGIHPDKIKVVRPFSEVYIPPSNFLVAPFMGISESELTFAMQIEEVADIIELPLVDFLNDDNVVLKIMDTSYSTNVAVPTFKVNEKYVWGATAMMMSELKEVLKSVL